MPFVPGSEQQAGVDGSTGTFNSELMMREMLRGTKQSCSRGGGGQVEHQLLEKLQLNEVALGQWKMMDKIASHLEDRTEK